LGNKRLLRVKDGCFGGVIAMDVRGVGNGWLYIHNFLENDFGGDCQLAPPNLPCAGFSSPEKPARGDEDC